VWFFFDTLGTASMSMLVLPSLVRPQDSPISMSCSPPSSCGSSDHPPFLPPGEFLETHCLSASFTSPPVLSSSLDKVVNFTKSSLYSHLPRDLLFLPCLATFFHSEAFRFVLRFSLNLFPVCLPPPFGYILGVSVLVPPFFPPLLPLRIFFLNPPV